MNEYDEYDDEYIFFVFSVLPAAVTYVGLSSGVANKAAGWRLKSKREREGIRI